MNNVQIAGLKWNDAKLIPVILQHASNNEVLMMAWMNEEALRETLKTGFACFWSRSRNVLWRKGETSGNRQKVIELWIDCDADTLLLKVEPEGPACHTGKPSCFFTKVT